MLCYAAIKTKILLSLFLCIISALELLHYYVRVILQLLLLRNIAEINV